MVTLYLTSRDFHLTISLVPPAADDVHVGPVAGRGGRVGDGAVLEGQVGHAVPDSISRTVTVALPSVGKIMWLKCTYRVGHLVVQ